MNKDDLKFKILEQWARYMPNPNRAEYQDKLKFYALLKDAYPEQIQWEAGTEMERWQNIQAWLNERKDSKTMRRIPTLLLLVGLVSPRSRYGA